MVGVSAVIFQAELVCCIDLFTSSLQWHPLAELHPNLEFQQHSNISVDDIHCGKGLKLLHSVM